MADLLEAVLEETDAEPGRATAPLNPASRAGLYPGSTLAYGVPKPRQPQAPIQPGSTPEGGEDGEVGARFLAYNKLGWVVSKAGDGQNYIEVRTRSAATPSPYTYVYFMYTRPLVYLSAVVSAGQSPDTGCDILLLVLLHGQDKPDSPCGGSSMLM
jgi:hypothetical protein